MIITYISRKRRGRNHEHVDGADSSNLITQENYAKSVKGFRLVAPCTWPPSPLSVAQEAKSLTAAERAHVAVFDAPELVVDSVGILGYQGCLVGNKAKIHHDLA
jgi:hypothetical protein